MTLVPIRSAIPAMLLGIAASAQAGKPTVTALAVSQPSVGDSQGPEVDALQAAATCAILRDDRLAGFDIAERIDSAGQGVRSAAAREGLTKSKAGHAAFDNLDLSQAIKEFGEAAQAYVGADARRSFDAYIQALLWQAASRWVNGDREGARAELARVFAEEPDVVLDKSAFPPDLMDEADRDRGEADAQTKVELEVTSDPPALVWIDGKPAGPSPLVAKVTPGRHLVAASAPGYTFASDRSVGSRVRLNLKPVAEADWVAGQRKLLASTYESGKRAATLKGIVDRLAVDQLVVLALEQDGGVRSLVAVRVAGDGHVLGFVRQSLAGSASPKEAAVGVMKAVLASDLPRGSGNQPVTDTGLEGGGFAFNLSQHGIALIVGTVGVAALVTGTIFGVVELHDRSNYSATPQTNQGGSQAWEQIGNRNAVVSDVMDIVGVVGLGAAAAVWFWPQSGSHAQPTERTEVLSFTPVPLPGGGLLSAAGHF
jgi:hypothetical protein